MMEFRRRFNVLERAIIHEIVTIDSLGLLEEKLPKWLKDMRAEPEVLNAYDDHGKWKFQTNFQKIGSFANWLKSKYSETILQEGMQELQDKYWQAYILDGYKKGAGKAFAAVHKAGLTTDPKSDAFYQGGQAQFLKDAFAQPETVEKTKLLAGRVLTDLEGVTSQMATQMSRTLTDGLVQGAHPRAIAKNLVKDLGISKNRAETIARTEIIRAHAEGQLDAFEKLKVEEIGVAVEWSTAGDSRVCPLCSPMDGVVYKTKEAHSLLPRHPNCRCSFLPANLGESTMGQQRGKAKIDAAMRASIKAEMSKKNKSLPLAQQKQLTKWAGGDLNVDKVRLKEIVKPKKGKGEYAPKPKAPQPNPIKEAAKKPPTPASPVPPPTPTSVTVKPPEPPKPTPPVAPAVPKPKAKPGPKPKPKPEPAPEPVKAPEPTPPKPKPVEFTPAGFPMRDQVKVVKTLPGSTGPKQVEDAKGKNWVMKEGLKPEHLQSEALADDLYRTLGVPTPKSGIVIHEGKPIKFSEFLPDAEPLGVWMNKAKPAELDKMLTEIQDNFAVDALLGNWDVAGMSMDNILVSKGIAYRVDNGGALLFRAQGAKKAAADFGKEVKELTSLRDPSKNPQTAQLFKGLTDEQIRNQVEDLVAVKDKLLDAVPDAKLRQLLSDRIDWMDENTRRFRKPAVADDFVEKVKASRINGRRLPADKGDIEDMGLLVWEEKDANGKLVTRVTGKLTPEGGEKLKGAVGDLPVTGSGGSVLVAGAPQDASWEHLLQAIKTVNTHAVDKAYNLAKVEYAENLIKYFDIQLANKALEPAYRQMYTYYKEMAQEVIEAKVQGVTLNKTYSQFVWTPPAKKDKEETPQEERRRVQINRQTNNIPTATIEKGFASRQNSSNTFDGEHLVMDVEDVAVKYFPPALPGSSSSRSGKAFENTIDLTIPGGVSKDNIEKVQKTISELGIDPTPSDDHLELMYLRKGLKLMKAEGGQFGAVLASGESESVKVQKLKELIKTEKGIDLEKVPTYDPKGRAYTGFGDGQHFWHRWDLTPDEVVKKLPKYTLFHNTSQGVSSVVEAMLNTGGQATSTVQRVRKGVSLGATGGMSSQADIKSGGADYFFTRLKANGGAGPGAEGLHFKIKNLARMDAVSYGGDYFGNTDLIHQGATTIEGYRANAKNSSNETIFKHGLSLIDDLERIVVHSQTQKDLIVKTFKDHKIEALSDGRKVEDVVVVKE